MVRHTVHTDSGPRRLVRIQTDFIVCGTAARQEVPDPEVVQTNLQEVESGRRMVTPVSVVGDSRSNQTLPHPTDKRPVMGVGLFLRNSVCT